MKLVDPESEPMRIAPRFTADNWMALTFSTEEEWEKGIEMLEDRIDGRFLQVIKRIQGYEYAGFAVLTLDCLLIETLQQLREGVPEIDRSIDFVRFLTGTSFSKYFDLNLAEMFYFDSKILPVFNHILGQLQIPVKH